MLNCLNSSDSLPRFTGFAAGVKIPPFLLSIEFLKLAGNSEIIPCGLITDFKTRKQFKKYNKAPLLDNYHESILKRNTAKKVELTDTPEGVQ